MNNYSKKYLKYKNKYLELNNKLIGGNEDDDNDEMINIHL